MGQIILPKSLHPDFATPGKKPIGPVEIDWSNPLSKGLKFVVLFRDGVAREAISGVFPGVTGDPEIKVLNRGWGATFDGNDVFSYSAISGITSPLSEAFDLASGFTYGFCLAFTTTGNTVIAEKGTGRQGPQTLSGRVHWKSAGSSGNASNSSIVNDGIPHNFTLSAKTVGANVRHIICLDGSLDIDEEKIYSADPVTSDPFVIGARNGGAFGFPGDLYYWFVWDRELSVAEGISHTANPYQILKPATAQVYNFPTVGGADHDLLADNLQSTSEVGTPTVTQEHVLLADDLQSLSQLSTPTATSSSEDALLADDLQSVSEVGTPAIGQDHTILADDLQSLSQLSTPAVGQEHTLLADDLQSLSQLSTPTATEVIGVNNLLADDLQSVSEVGTPAIGQEHAVLADDLESTSSLSTPTVGQEHVLLADDLQSLSQLSTPSVVEDTVNELLADDLESTSEIGTATIAQVHVLLSDSLQSLSSISTPDIASVNIPLIEGASSVVINTNGGSKDLYFNGTDYFEVA